MLRRSDARRNQLRGNQLRPEHLRLPKAAGAQVFLSSKTFGSLAEWLGTVKRDWRLPVLVPVYNNPTYARSMASQLVVRDLEVIFIDNASDPLLMESCLKEIENHAFVVRLAENFGPFIFKDEAAYQLLPEKFCVTDPDLALNPSLPMDFLEQLSFVTERFRIGKAGFALDISEPQLLKEERVAVPGGFATCWEWEAQFWSNQIGSTEEGDPIYLADIDTTFAIYNKKYFDPRNHYAAIRVAGKYTAKHLPWYKSTKLPADEDLKYRLTQRYSTYQSSNVGLRTTPAFDHYVKSVFDQLKPRSVCEVRPGLGRYGLLAKEAGERHGYAVDALAVDGPLGNERKEQLSAIYGTVLDKGFSYLIEQHEQTFDLVLLNGVLPELRRSEGLDLLHALICRSTFIAVLLPDFAQAHSTESMTANRSYWRDEDFAGWPSIRHSEGGVTLFLFRGQAPTLESVG